MAVPSRPAGPLSGRIWVPGPVLRTRVLGGAFIYRGLFIVRDGAGWALLALPRPNCTFEYLIPFEQILRSFQLREPVFGRLSAQIYGHLSKNDLKICIGCDRQGLRVLKGVGYGWYSVRRGRERPSDGCHH